MEFVFFVEKRFKIPCIAHNIELSRYRYKVAACRFVVMQYFKSTLRYAIREAIAGNSLSWITIVIQSPFATAVSPVVLESRRERLTENPPLLGHSLIPPATRAPRPILSSLLPVGRIVRLRSPVTLRTCEAHGFVNVPPH
jgi:hypothetical protein